MLEGKATGRPPIGEAEIVEHCDRRNRFGLRLRELLKPRGVPQIVGNEAERALRRRGLSRRSRAAGGGREEDRRRDSAAGKSDRHGIRGRQSGVVMTRVAMP